VFDHFSDESKAAFNLARQCALANHTAYIDDVHILVGCCRAPESLAARVLLGCGQDPVEVVARAETRVAQLASESSSTSQLPFTPSAKKVLELAMEEAARLDHKWIGTHHVLLGLLREEGLAAEVLARGGLNVVDARWIAQQIHEQKWSPAEERKVEASARPRSHVEILRDAQAVCVELQQFELASQLRDLAHRLEHPR
jgi:ATP-dependent Clp protease ATP-binding subunit ClpC